MYTFFFFGINSISNIMTIEIARSYELSLLTSVLCASAFASLVAAMYFWGLVTKRMDHE